MAHHRGLGDETGATLIIFWDFQFCVPQPLPTPPLAAAVVLLEAVWHYGQDLQHGSYGNIIPQAPQWDSTMHHYNVGWPQGGAAYPYASCAPRPTSLTPPRARTRGPLRYLLGGTAEAQRNLRLYRDSVITRSNY